MERQLRDSGWREGADTATTSDMVQRVLTLPEGDAAGGPQGVDEAIEEMRRTTLLHSQCPELRVAALSIGPGTYVEEHLLKQASIRLHDPDPQVRVAAARLLGERGPPVSIEALSLSAASEAERDPDVRNASWRAAARVWEPVRATWEERRAARR